MFLQQEVGNTYVKHTYTTIYKLVVSKIFLMSFNRIFMITRLHLFIKIAVTVIVKYYLNLK